MPAIIAHELFGREIYNELHSLIGDSKDECNAFLLGCQGPDVFFFGSLNPLLASTWGIGTRMHKDDPDALLLSMRNAASMLAPDAKGIGRAYILGLIAHYALDSTMHPFIYSQQKAICNAGVEGLDESDGHEVHAEIESELDVLCLSHKEEKTIRDFNPARQTLRGNDYVLQVISALYKLSIKEVYSKNIPDDAFLLSTKAYRLSLQAMYSPEGIKRELLGMAEKLFKRHSFIHAMSHESRLVYESIFENREREPWVDPATLQERTESFWDLYDMAASKTRRMLMMFDSASGNQIRAETNGVDFNGNLTRATIISIE